MLKLGDLREMSDADVIDHIIVEYGASSSEIEGCEILIAYESVGMWGCDSASFFLLRREGVLMTVCGSHCSCNGFEGQWDPQETALVSIERGVSTGGYDVSSESNEREIIERARAIYAESSR